MAEQGRDVAAIVFQYRRKAVALFLRHPHADYAHVKQRKTVVFLALEPPVDGDGLAPIVKLDLAVDDKILLFALAAPHN